MIMGHPASIAIRAVTSTPHLKLKFPTPSGVGEVREIEKLPKNATAKLWLWRKLSSGTSERQSSWQRARAGRNTDQGHPPKHATNFRTLKTRSPKTTPLPISKPEWSNRFFGGGFNSDAFYMYGVVQVVRLLIILNKGVNGIISATKYSELECGYEIIPN